MPVHRDEENRPRGGVAFSSPVRVGKIFYTNSLPFYHRLQKNDFLDIDFYDHFPAQINMAMQQKQVDIAPISSLEYLNHQEDYVILSNFAIGSRDFSRSVILFSRDKIETLSGAQIALSRESLSSSSLLKIILKFKYKFENQFEVVDSNPDAMLKKYPAALVIGDDALFYQPKEFVYKYDLSELWWNWTEKPFCFALWAVRKEYAKEHPEEVAFFSQMLKKNLERNLTNIESLIKESLGLSFIEERFSKIFGYLFNLCYTLDPAMQEGLELFYRLSNLMKFSPEPKPLEFFQE
jgi:chorismate dehydratase